jgi:hypothetical protein
MKQMLSILLALLLTVMPMTASGMKRALLSSPCSSCERRTPLSLPLSPPCPCFVITSTRTPSYMTTEKENSPKEDLRFTLKIQIGFKMP